MALPGPDLVRQTWICAVPMPRGFCEGEAAGLTLLPSHVVSVPGIAECPVNLECRVELAEEKYLSKKEQEQITGWHRRWREIYGNMQSAERKKLKDRLATVCHLVSAEQWSKVHAFLAAE